MTQNEVADQAKIDRSRYNALEKGEYEMTSYYASRLEPVLGDEVWRLLPVQPALPEPIRGPSIYDRVRALEAQVRDLAARLAALESDR